MSLDVPSDLVQNSQTQQLHCKLHNKAMQSEITLHLHVAPLTFDLVAMGSKQLMSCTQR